MKRILWMTLMIVLLAGVMFVILYRKGTKDVPLSNIEQEMSGEIEADGLQKFGDMKLRRNFGLLAEDYDDVLYFGKDDSMTVEALLVVKAREESQVEAVMEALRTYVSDRITAFSGYGPTQVALLERSECFSMGNYAALIISDRAPENAAKLKAILEE